MNAENTQKLIDAAPHLYGSAFYFECGDGWFDLLMEASIKLENQILSYPESIRQDIVANQVKEKYGSLRFYISYYTEELDEIIDSAEKKSACVCETCGAPGKIRGSSWLYCACDEHTLDMDKKIVQNTVP
jgi:hypothetical protein